jgi:acyl-CoA reductase-like NAD-dependent aldehyde dehydrogenase
MSKSENVLAFEAALKESKELQEKFAAAKKRIVENQEAATDVELLVKAAAQVGYTLNEDELARAIAQMQELSEEELEKVAGGIRVVRDPIENTRIDAGKITTSDIYGCTCGFYVYNYPTWA